MPQLKPHEYTSQHIEHTYSRGCRSPPEKQLFPLELRIVFETCSKRTPVGNLSASSAPSLNPTENMSGLLDPKIDRVRRVSRLISAQVETINGLLQC